MLICEKVTLMIEKWWKVIGWKGCWFLSQFNWQTKFLKVKIEVISVPGTHPGYQVVKCCCLLVAGQPAGPPGRLESYLPGVFPINCSIKILIQKKWSVLTQSLTQLLMTECKIWWTAKTNNNCQDWQQLPMQITKARTDNILMDK